MTSAVATLATHATKNLDRNSFITSAVLRIVDVGD
jgi:hypothetical protein